VCTYTQRRNPKYFSPEEISARDLLQFLRNNEPKEFPTEVESQTLPEAGREALRKYSEFEKAKIEEQKKQYEKNSPPEYLFSEKTLMEKLRIDDSIIRDAFCSGMTAEKLFSQYKLVPTNGERT
jgi:hypothetical protein